MKCVILAGGLGTRLSEETILKPKPMIEIGNKPILWHIMKIYSAYGINEFIICLGYKGYVIKEYFSNYSLHMSDVTFDMARNKVEIHQNSAENWKITLVDTGENTMTGGRLKRVRDYIADKTFCFTYGDGVSDVNIRDLVAFHEKQKATATVTAVTPPGRFGVLNIENSQVKKMEEKPHGDGNWINGGFFVLDSKVFELIVGDSTVWERDPLQRLAKEGRLSAFQHRGFWQPMDTLRDRNLLEDLWNSGKAPWKVW